MAKMVDESLPNNTEDTPVATRDTAEDSRTRAIARESAREAVRETLNMLGIDAENPREAQADFQTLRRLRSMLDKSTLAAIWVFVTLVLSGLATLVWDAVKNGTGPK